MPDDLPVDLTGVLRSHVGATGPLGELSTIDRDALRHDLGRLDQHLQSHYRVMLILFTAIFIIGVVIAFVFVNGPEQAAAVIGVIGLSAGGAVKKLGDTGRQIANLRLVIALVSALNSDQVSLVVQVLAAKL